MTTKLIKKLDSVFSQYVRLTYADRYGYCTCVTCPTRRPRQEMQCAHYIGRMNMATRWYTWNCAVACPECNTSSPTHHDLLGEHLSLRHGPERPQTIAELSRELVHWQDYELGIMISAYTKKVQFLKKHLN